MSDSDYFSPTVIRRRPRLRLDRRFCQKCGCDLMPENRSRSRPTFCKPCWAAYNRAHTNPETNRARQDRWLLRRAGGRVSRRAAAEAFIRSRGLWDEFVEGLT
jgi:hypothetical protein